MDQLHRVLIHLLKVVRGVEEAVAPVVPQPVDVLLDGVYEFLVLLGGVCVVHAKITDTAVLLRRTEVHKDGLGVTDVQIAVRLGRKTGMDLLAGVLPTLGDILINKIVDEILGHPGVQLFRHRLQLLAKKYTSYRTGNLYILSCYAANCNSLFPEMPLLCLSFHPTPLIGLSFLNIVPAAHPGQWM